MDFGETLELSETPCGRSVRRRCVYTSNGERAIRLPSCFLLYQIFARVRERRLHLIEYVELAERYCSGL